MTTRWARPALAALVLAALTAVPAQATDALDPVLGDPGRTLPNLVPDVQFVAILETTMFDPLSGTNVPLGPAELYFDTRAQNLGSVPLQLTVDEVESPESSSVSQCVSWRVGRICRAQEPVGGFTWDPEHDHFHFNEFASYQLRKVLGNGRVDYSSRGLVAATEKVSFCLYDAQRVRDEAEPGPFYAAHCTPTVQGISPGWTDIYDQGLPGQQFSTQGVTDGRYALVVSMDYLDHVRESVEADNVVEIILDISGGVRQVEIVDRRYPTPK